MGLVTKNHTFVAGALIIASEHNENFDTLYNLVNGNLDNANIASGAGITDDKLAQITTAGKIGGSALDSIIEALHPVGSIYINVTGVNPATELGTGTWTAFGAGRVMVGYDSGDTDFDTAEETGGAKTHTLTTDEMPSHTHEINTNDGAANQNTYVAQWDGTGVAETQTSEATGGGSAHNNVQPYIVVHMWKRTA